MEKTLMQRIHETPLDVKKAIYSSGYKVCKFTMISEIKDILEDCSCTNGIMIVRALQDLIEKYGEKDAR
jgi:hypothetical protein